MQPLLVCLTNSLNIETGEFSKSNLHSIFAFIKDEDTSKIVYLVSLSLAQDIVASKRWSCNANVKLAPVGLSERLGLAELPY